MRSGDGPLFCRDRWSRSGQGRGYGAGGPFPFALAWHGPELNQILARLDGIGFEGFYDSMHELSLDCLSLSSLSARGGCPS